MASVDLKSTVTYVHKHEGGCTGPRSTEMTECSAWTWKSCDFCLSGECPTCKAMIIRADRAQYGDGP